MWTLRFKSNNNIYQSAAGMKWKKKEVIMFIRIRRKRKPRRISTDLYYDHKNNDFSVFCCCYCCCWCCCNFINEGELEMSNSVFFSLHSIQLSLLILLNFVLCSFCNCWTKRKIMYEDGFSFFRIFVIIIEIFLYMAYK